MTEKRDGGQTVRENGQKIWLVMSESTKENEGWLHNCGNAVITTTVYLSNRVPKNMGMPLAGSGEVQRLNVPYCPNCENRPTGGIFYYSGGWHINTWEKS